MYTCNLNIHGVRLRIRAQQQEKIHQLESLYSLFLLPEDSEPEIEAEWTDEAEPDILSLLARHNLFAFHAGAYQDDKGKGIFLPGIAASGKTTIVFSALTSGYPLIGDDVVLCRQDGSGFQLLPFKGYLLLKKGGTSEIYHVPEHHSKDVFCTTYAGVIVFPHIVGEALSTIKRLYDKRLVFAGMLRSAVWVSDRVLRKKQASIIEELSTLPAYNLFLSRDHKRRPQLAVELLSRI